MCAPMFGIEVEWHGTVFMEERKRSCDDDGDDDDVLGKEKEHTRMKKAYSNL